VHRGGRGAGIPRTPVPGSPTKAAKKTSQAQTPSAKPPKAPPGAKTPKSPQAGPTRPVGPPAPAAGAAAQKLSALDAAARLLAETGQAMTCPAMIQALAAQGYWTSPKGKTPAATLHAAMSREIRSKGVRARFRKTDRGTFARA
jgi:hypothetical protein